MWLRILKIRNFTLEKRILLKKLIHEIKLHQIVGPQLGLLNEWVKLEGKNYEAISRVIRKLSAILVRVPLIQDAKVYIHISYYTMLLASIQIVISLDPLSPFQTFYYTTIYKKKKMDCNCKLNNHI